MSDAGGETSAARAAEGCHCRVPELPPCLSIDALLGLLPTGLQLLPGPLLLLLLPLQGILPHWDALLPAHVEADPDPSTGAVTEAIRRPEGSDADAGHMDASEAAEEEAAGDAMRLFHRVMYG